MPDDVPPIGGLTIDSQSGALVYGVAIWQLKSGIEP